MTNTLTIQDLETRVPAAFNMLGPSMRTTNRYKFLPTLPLIEELMSVGFKPVQASQQGSRIVGGADFARHFIRFEHPDLTHDSMQALGDSKVQVILDTAHNGTRAHTLMIGLFRLVCLNGLTVHTVGSKSRIIHTGSAQDKLGNALKHVKVHLPIIVDQVGRMQRTVIDEGQFVTLAKRILMRRFNLDSLSDVDDISLPGVLTARRSEDQPNTVWNILNRIQENLTNGNVQRWDASNRLRNTRRVTSLTGREDINKIVWQEAVKLIAA